MESVATHPDCPYLLGKSIISKIIINVRREGIGKLSLTEAIDRINQITAETYFSTMAIGLCSFTNKVHDYEDVFCKKIRGCANTHRLPGGMIQCSNEGEHFIECCNIIHNIRNVLFPISFTNIYTNLRIPRSSKTKEGLPTFSSGEISNNSAIWISKSRGTFHVKVEFTDNGNRLEKCVSLIELLEANSMKIIELKPRVYGEEYISNQEENVQRLFNFFNQKYKDFISEEILPQFEKEQIPYTLNYLPFDFENEYPGY